METETMLDDTARELEVVRRYKVYERMSRITAMTGYDPTEIYAILKKHGVPLVHHNKRQQMRNVMMRENAIPERSKIQRLLRKLKAAEEERDTIKRDLYNTQTELAQVKLRLRWTGAGVEG